MSQAPLDRAWIAAHIPHQGSMCLLDAAVDWSATAIACRATSHTDPANPLRADGRLGAATGIEYAAQAMAIHGALLAKADDPPRQGYLTSVRSVTLHVARLDDLPGELDVQAERLSGDGNHILYRFSVSHAGRCLFDGRAAVMLDAAAIGKGNSDLFATVLAEPVEAPGFTKTALRQTCPEPGRRAQGEREYSAYPKKGPP